MNEREILKCAATLCEKAIRDLAPRFGPHTTNSSEEVLDIMVEEHLANRAATDAAILSWLDAGMFSHDLSETVMRQAFFRVVGAMKQLPVIGDAVLRDLSSDGRSPEGLLRFLLVDFWTNASSWPTRLLKEIAKGQFDLQSFEGAILPDVKENP